MQNDKSTNSFAIWRTANPATSFTPEQNQRINQWVDISHAMLDAFDQFEDEIEPWLKGLSRIEPDLVKYISRYGFIIEVTGNWTDLPIDIPMDEVDHWDKHSSLVVSMEQLEDWRAAVSGSAIEMLQINTQLTISTIRNQLHGRYESLAKLSQESLRYFAPTQWGEDEVGEEYTLDEAVNLDAIFKKYEELYCFEQGIEMLRMITITEDDPDFDLPNKSFYDALVSIDSQTLMEVLHLAEPKLKAILKLWSDTVMEYNGKPYYKGLRDAPDTFWWRHWEVSAGHKTKGKRSNGRGRSSRK